MNFRPHQRREPPSVIIISLIDILIVLLIFLMVTTTFRQAPVLSLELPASATAGVEEENTRTVVLTIAKEEPHFYFGLDPISPEELETKLKAAIEEQDKEALIVRADVQAPRALALVVEAYDAAKLAGFKQFSLQTDRKTDE